MQTISPEQSGSFIEKFTLPPTNDGPLRGLRFAVKDLIDVAGHTTALLLQGSFSGDKTPRTFAPVGLALFYLADAKNPDIYRVQPGKF